MLSIKILMAAIFIVTGGAIFSERFKKYGWLTVAAGIVSIIGAYYLVRGIIQDLPSDIREDLAITSVASKGTSKYIAQCKNKFIRLTKGRDECGYFLSNDFSFFFEGQFIAKIIVDGGYGAKYQPEAVWIYPPSPSGEKVYLGANKYEYINEFIWDKKENMMLPIVTSRYGPEKWVEWTDDERFALHMIVDDGTTWLTITDTFDGKVVTWPKNIDYYPKDNPRLFELTKGSDGASIGNFKWIDKKNRIFSVDLSLIKSKIEYIKSIKIKIENTDVHML